MAEAEWYIREALRDAVEEHSAVGVTGYWLKTEKA